MTPDALLAQLVTQPGDVDLLRHCPGQAIMAGRVISFFTSPARQVAAMGCGVCVLTNC